MFYLIRLFLYNCCTQDHSSIYENRNIEIVNPTPRTYTFNELNESIPTELRTSHEKVRVVFVNGGNLTISNPSDGQIKNGLAHTIETNQDLFARLDGQDECVQTVLNPDDLTGTIEYVRKDGIYSAITKDGQLTSFPIEEIASIFIAYRNNQLHLYEGLLFAKHDYPEDTTRGKTNGCLGNASVSLILCMLFAYALFW